MSLIQEIPVQELPVDSLSKTSNSQARLKEETHEQKTKRSLPSQEQSDEESVQDPEIDYRSPEVIKYFEKQPIIKKGSQHIASSLLAMCHQNLKQQINIGYTIIPTSNQSIDDLLSLSAAHNKSEQAERQGSKHRLIELPPAPPEHKQFMERMNKARKVNQDRRRLKQQYQQKKRQQLMAKQAQERAKRQQQKREQRQQQFKEKMSQLQKRKQKSKQEQMEAIKRYKSVVHERRIHEIMSEKYEKNVVLPMLQEQKRKLSERSQKIKGYSIDQIRNFQKQYIKKEQEKPHTPVKQSWEYTPPPIHPRLHQIIEDEKIRYRIKLQQKKRALEQKISRQQNYVQHLKETVSITIDANKKLELEKLNHKPDNPAKSIEEIKSIGNNYLQELKSKLKHIRKKENYSTREESQEKSRSAEKIKSNTSMSHYDRDHVLSQTQQEKVNQLIASKRLNKVEKVNKLKYEVEKLSQKVKRNEELERVCPRRKNSESGLQQLLSSIKAKVGIMHLLNS